MTPSPTPFPVPLPVAFGPHEADWAMVALTAAGIVVTGLIAWLTLRATRIANASREVADKAQVRALEAYSEALNRSHESTARQTELLANLVAQTNVEPTGGESLATDVKWLLERDGKNLWIVRNMGTATALAATVDGLTEQDRADLSVFHPAPVDIPPYGTIPFRIDRSMASPPATVIVIRWADELSDDRSLSMVVT